MQSLLAGRASDGYLQDFVKPVFRRWRVRITINTNSLGNTIVNYPIGIIDIQMMIN